jgi:hypothetical protein
MKTNREATPLFKSIWNTARNLIIIIVSGIPVKMFRIGPTNKSRVYTRNTKLKKDEEKHYHFPRSKPAVETQTLLKERKKTTNKKAMD